MQTGRIDRRQLSTTPIRSLWRLARFLGLTEKECHCIRCQISVIEWCARKLDEATIKHAPTTRNT